MATNNRHFKNTNKNNKTMRDMFCINHSGKMREMISLSSSPAANGRCKHRAECGGDDCICTHCYSRSMMEIYDALGVKLAANTEALTSEIIPGVNIPEVNEARHPYGRIEAFGDLVNEVHAINYISLIGCNPSVFWGWWTKNPDIIAAALVTGEYEIPENVNVIYSNPIIDKPIRLADIQKIYPFVKKVFNVFSSAEKARELGYKINCGANYCRGCGICYSDNDITEVNEILKNR